MAVTTKTKSRESGTTVELDLIGKAKFHFSGLFRTRFYLESAIAGFDTLKSVAPEQQREVLQDIVDALVSAQKSIAGYTYWNEKDDVKKRAHKNNHKHNDSSFGQEVPILLSVSESLSEVVGKDGPHALSEDLHESIKKVLGISKNLKKPQAQINHISSKGLRHLRCILGHISESLFAVVECGASFENNDLSTQNVLENARNSAQEAFNLLTAKTGLIKDLIQLLRKPHEEARARSPKSHSAHQD